MHALIPFHLVARFCHLLVEGAEYEISDFYVTDFIGKYKCLNNNKHIVFSDTTTVVTISLPNVFAPSQIFDFTHLAIIDEANFQDSHCVGNY